MATTVVLFHRDLRVHDHPALVAATAEADHVVPLFVLDPVVLRRAGPNRRWWLAGSLADLRSTLRAAGADLIVRSGDPVGETMRVVAGTGATAVRVSADVSDLARRREDRLADACRGARVAFHADPGVTAVPPGAVAPDGRDHYRVFTPYWRAWRDLPWRRVQDPPSVRAVPRGLAPGNLPDPEELAGEGRSPALAAPGETAGRARLAWALREVVDGYEGAANLLASSGTSRLGADLHFGTVSPLEVATRLAEHHGGEAMLRQLCWRDFHHQVVAAFPAITRAEYRPRGDRWRRSSADLEAWKDGRTGYPIVDAGMRQLRAEGWMHNRARLVTASFLTKTLFVDWRLGADHFFSLLVDGDVVNNYANWQWVAGTGTDTRPNRVLNPLRQAERFDPDGIYVRRWVPELADLDALEGGAVHRPWRLDPSARRRLAYPERIVDHEVAAAAFLARRKG